MDEEQCEDYVLVMRLADHLSDDARMRAQLIYEGCTGIAACEEIDLIESRMRKLHEKLTGE